MRWEWRSVFAARTTLALIAGAPIVRCAIDCITMRSIARCQVLRLRSVAHGVDHISAIDCIVTDCSLSIAIPQGFSEESFPARPNDMKRRPTTEPSAPLRAATLQSIAKAA